MATSFTTLIYDPVIGLALRSTRRTVTLLLQEYKNRRIVDLCGGTGAQLKHLAQTGFSDLHCVDLAPDMLAIAQKGNYPINIYERDATRTGFPDRYFTVAIISFALHEKDQPTQSALIREAFRLLEKDGILAVVDYRFDSFTHPLVQKVIETVEWIAGGLHYNNFRQYLKNNGLESIIPKNLFQQECSIRKLNSGAVINLYRKLN